MCAWVPPGMCLKMIGRSTLRKHHDFDEIFSFGKRPEDSLETTSLETMWAEDGRTTVTQSQNKDIEKFWKHASKDVLKKTLNVDEAKANRQAWANAKTISLKFEGHEDESRQNLKSHYKSNFSTDVLTSPSSPRGPQPRPGSALDSVQQAKQNKALGKQSSVCLTYY